MHDDRALIAETRRFTAESPNRSRWYLASSLALLILALAGAAALPHVALRIGAAIVAGLLVVRVFTLYHDHMHGSMLPRSPIARAVYRAFGVLVLAPPTVWKQTHDYHHAHTAKLVGSHVGSFAMMTTQMYRHAPEPIRRQYRVVRHPLTILFGYVTIFVYGMCISPLMRAPRKHWDAGVALALHAVIVGFTAGFFGVATTMTVVVAPLAVACALGSYLFYAQHNFPGVVVKPRHEWSHVQAALESSSFMDLGPVMRWFTGNIGYHHVHHLNAAIPFYRLPEAMAAIEPLQHGTRTTLHPRDVLACLRLKVWDPANGCMTGWPDVGPQSRAENVTEA